MIEGRAGIFLVKVDGETIWDKHEQNDEFPEEGFICESIAACGK
jgi:predicted Rdx family selenoprotein